MANLSSFLVDPNQCICDVSELSDLFAFAKHKISDFKIGVELEFFPVDVNTFTQIPYAGKSSVSAILSAMLEQFEWEGVFEGAHLIGLRRGSENISLEPGGVIEYASEPLSSIQLIATAQQKFINELLTLSLPLGIDFLLLGYLPYDDLASINLVPKSRYDFMYALMPKVGSKGREMMKLTSATQVSIDYSSEADAMKKFVLAAKSTPVFLAMFANSSIKQGEFINKACYRADVWNDTDASRVGLQDFIFNENASFSDYVEWALDVPMYYIERNNKKIFMDDKTFREFFNEGEATFLDWENHLIDMFSWVRLRHYVEIRTFDMAKPDLQLSAAALVKGLFYDDTAMNDLSLLLSSWGRNEVDNLIKAAANDGLDGAAGNIQLREVAISMLDIAYHGLVRQGVDEEKYLVPLQNHVKHWHLQELKNAFESNANEFLKNNLLSKS